MKITTLQVLLVLGAAGGVGLSAVQIGKVCGAVVIAVARYLFHIEYGVLYRFIMTLQVSIHLDGNMHFHSEFQRS